MRALVVLSLFAASIALAGCGGMQTARSREEDFQRMVDDTNAQHPPLYDGADTSYPPP